MKQTEYKIGIVGGHIIVTDDRGENLLIDTGSPMSFHSEGRIALCDEVNSVPTSLMGADADYVGRKVGAHVGGLLGMDLIGRWGVLIDVPNGKVVFGHGSDSLTPIPSKSFFGYILAEMELNGRKATVIIDTGAPISYVSPSITEGLESLGTETDFNPMVPGDTFETPIFEFTASFGGKAFEMRAGHLPSVLGNIVSLLGVEGVVGMELLKHQPLLIAEGRVWL